MDRGAVGIYGGLAQVGANLHPGTINILLNGLRILRVRHTFGVSSEAQCAPGWVYVQYLSGLTLQTSAQALDLPRSYVDVGPPIRIIPCNVNQILELRFQLSPTAGYFEIRINNNVVLSQTGLNLGYASLYEWNGIQIAPSGLVHPSGDNAGMTALYVNEVDTYGAGNSTIIDENYANLTDAQLWEDLGGPWLRLSALGQAVTTEPYKAGDRVVANINMMQRLNLGTGVPPEPGEGVTTISDELIDICCDEGQQETVQHEGGGQSNGADLFQTPTIGEVVGCVGGGTVPTQADITFAENWLS